MSEEANVGPIITSAMPAAESVRFIVVGAGGTGGRLIPALMQVVRRGDSVAIVDGDHVEDRNLARQNFRARDVGVNKAEVMARRYLRDGIQVDAYAAMISTDNARAIMSGRQASKYVFLGCVDNPEARQVISAVNLLAPSIWIDGGNEMRGGQVILSARSWPFKIKGMVKNDPYDKEAPPRYTEHSGPYGVRGMKAMPQLLKLKPWHCDRCNIDNAVGVKKCEGCNQPEASCRDRIDLQTVAVNQLSASCMLNIVSCILHGVPMMSCGAFFSTLNTMSPIKLDRVDWDRSEVIPELRYAEKE